MGGKFLSQRERGRGEGTGASIKRQTLGSVNPREHGIEIVADFRVGEPGDVEAEALEDLGPVFVIV
jgi:hypothetical protein